MGKHACRKAGRCALSLLYISLLAETVLYPSTGGAWDLEKSSDEEQKGVIQERNQYIKSNEKYIQILKK